MSSARPSVIIVGAGFGGLGMALELRRAGFDNFTILERASEVGGVWRENTYPGVGCDVPSPLYSFSFEPKPDWPMRFSLRADIHRYISELADKYRLADKIRFDTEVTDAEFDERTGTWTVRTADGVTYTADVLIPAVGQLSRPAMPAIAGVDSFAGPAFHSATWNHDVDLTGKRVAVIGTGASAIQFVPAIQPDVAGLTLFQRSAAWVLPKPDRSYRPWHHAVFERIPLTRLAERFGIWLGLELISLGFADISAALPLVAKIADRHLRNQVDDPGLRARLRPDYPVGCKRALFSDNYFPALTQPNVRVETTAITEVVPTGVRTADDVTHEADVIIYGTGFKGTEFLWPLRIRGAGGRTLSDEWQDRGGARAYLGMTVPHFPNLFIVYGPNTNLGAGSIIYMIESQTRYIRKAVEALASKPGHYLDVRAEVAERFDGYVQGRLARTPWNFCSSWYRNAAGRITNNWPGTVTGYRRRTRKLDLADYTVVPAAEQTR